MYYTGIDLHRKTSFITTVDSDGRIIMKANLPNDEPTILEYFLSLDKDRHYQMVERRYLDGPHSWEESAFSWAV